MSDSEKTSFIQFLVTESQKKDQQISHLQKAIDSQGERLNGMQITLDDIQRTQHATRNENTKLSAQLTTQGAHLKSMQAALKKALQQADKYKSLYEVLRDEKFVGTSQKYGKPRPEPGRDDNKGNWDVPAQDEPNIEEETDHKAIEEEANEIPKEKIKRPYREGLKYDKMQAQATPHEIKKRRNGAETTSIIASIWMELNRQLEQPLPKGNLMQQALTYLKNTWKHVMAYRNDGRYDIDNSIAERAIRTLTIERKNSMAFGNHRGAEISTVYHIFLATCKMKTLSFRNFLKEYFTAIMQGRTDYENLTPEFIGKNN